LLSTKTSTLSSPTSTLESDVDRLGGFIAKGFDGFWLIPRITNHNTSSNFPKLFPCRLSISPSTVRYTSNISISSHKHT
jgi:hypothetical protein